MKKIFLTIQVVLAIGLIAFVIYFQTAKKGAHGLLGGDFQIPTSEGFYRLQDDRGKVVLLYFGYRFCPDICPTTLSVLARAYGELGEDVKKRVRVVFVSVDTERDNVKNLKDYAEFFHSDFVGATDTVNRIALLANMYGVKYKKFVPESVKDGDGDKVKGYYSVDHTTQTFLIGTDGLVKALLRHGEDKDQIKKEILKYLSI